MTFDVIFLAKQGELIKWAENDCGAATSACHLFK